MEERGSAPGERVLGSDPSPGCSVLDCPYTVGSGCSPLSVIASLPRTAAVGGPQPVRAGVPKLIRFDLFLISGAVEKGAWPPYAPTLNRAPIAHPGRNE